MAKLKKWAQFEFHQSDIQNEGGWCSGISSYLGDRLADGKVRSAEDAFAEVKVECEVLLEKANDLIQQRTLRRKQKAKDGGCFGVHNESGAWVYNFTGSGVALLNLSVSDSTVRWVYGAWFQWRAVPTFLASMNHAGLTVWDPKKMFIFDPNVGGSLWDMPGYSLASVLRYSGPALIDQALEDMYSNDSLAKNRKRRAVVRSAVFVKQKTEPLGRVLIL